ncbi:MAG: hypothetical protein LBR54_03485 [Oscillospiraceae bacterium]|jgi:hypothetical protein|nr:hypothetical protein [Oscillospiraceae bacterium]
MKIFQLVPSLVHGDAVSNHVLAIAAVLNERGYINGIVIPGIIKKNSVKIPKPSGTGRKHLTKTGVFCLKKFKPQKDDVLIYHMAIGSELTEFVISADVRKKIMIYHNITPEHFFQNMPELYARCKEGRQQLERLVEHIDFSICDSEYNEMELLSFFKK